MATLSSWVVENWFNLFQTLGIMGSLWLAAVAAHHSAKARDSENLLKISEHHRELWHEARQRPDLQRIFLTDESVFSKAPSVAEDLFLNEVILHFQTSWRIARAGGIVTLRELRDDVRGFFSLPLPRAVWEKTRAFRNQRFVKFVDFALR
jgi:hypothetical protein